MRCVLLLALFACRVLSQTGGTLRLQTFQAAPGSPVRTGSSKLGDTQSSPDFNWAPQSPGGTLSVGTQTIILSPVPAGVNGTNQVYTVHIADSAPEDAPVTGGTAISGASSGTLIITCAHAHTGAWTVSSSTSGITEAANYVAALGGGTVNIPLGTYQLYSTVLGR